MDGRSQWPTISQGKPSARTEFVYNIDEILNNSAIRYMITSLTLEISSAILKITVPFDRHLNEYCFQKPLLV